MHAKEDNPELLKAQELGLKRNLFISEFYSNGQNKTHLCEGVHVVKQQ
jgi:hypothetical protein